MVGRAIEFFHLGATIAFIPVITLSLFLFHRQLTKQQYEEDDCGATREREKRITTKKS